MASVTIYVFLPEEAVDVWRPVEAELVAPGIYRITSPDPDPEDEVWEFRSGDLVRCELRRLDAGEHLVAVEAVVDANARKDPRRPMRVDPEASSADPALPAFLARQGAPVYHGFPLVPESRQDGWVFGTISEFEDPAGRDWGDAFVVAPDGARAGIVWSVGTFPTKEVCPPDAGRWGVYAFAVPRPVRTADDMVRCFQAMLPELKAIHARVRRPP